MINKLRGTYDLMPEDAKKWQFVESTFKEILNNYGYGEIRTPLIEETALFTRSIGETSDIVTKEIYAFNDRKGRSIALRPEGTASIVRAYIEASIKSDVLTKWWYSGDMFRYDRPQKGRYREFRQMGVEVFGSASPAVDAEVISLAICLLQTIGLKDLTLYLNSVGCTDCRRLYYSKLKNYFNSLKDTEKKGLCETCKIRLEKNPMRIFDCKEEGCRLLLKSAPTITESLCEDCASDFESVKNYLDLIGIAYVVNPRLVRGLDYYTKTAFEIVYEKMDSAQQNALAAGGRYDNLTQELGGSSTPAIGFAIGMERILYCMELAQIQSEVKEEKSIYFAFLGATAEKKAFKLIDNLRRKGLCVFSNPDGKSLKSQMREADRLKAGSVIILGEDELAKNIVILKNMKSGEQKEVKIGEIENELVQSTEYRVQGTKK